MGKRIKIKVEWLSYKVENVENPRHSMPTFRRGKLFCEGMSCGFLLLGSSAIFLVSIYLDQGNRRKIEKILYPRKRKIEKVLQLQGILIGKD
jgi:hypothetical protein